MKQVRYLSISFLAMFVAGALLFIYQTRRLAELGRHAEALSATVTTADPPPDGIPAPDSIPVAPAPESAPPASQTSETFLVKLKEALANSLTKDQVVVFLNLGGSEVGFEGLAAAANLTGEERETIRRGLEQFDGQRAELYLNRGLAPASLSSGLAEVKRGQEAWLAAQLGKERHDEVLRSGERQARASAERRAAESVSRINSATDLTQEQKDGLYAGFLELNLHPPKAAEEKLTVETFANLAVGPSVPDLSEDAENILTAEQRQLYQIQRAASGQTSAAQSQVAMGMMESLMPAVMKLLEDGR